MKKLCLFLFALFSVIAAQAWTVGVLGNYNNWSLNTSGDNAMKCNTTWDGKTDVTLTDIPIGKNQAVRIVVLSYDASMEGESGSNKSSSNHTFYGNKTITLDSNGVSNGPNADNSYVGLERKVQNTNPSSFDIKIEGSRDGDLYKFEINPNSGWVKVTRTTQGPETSDASDLDGYEFYYKYSADNWADHYVTLTGNVAKFTVNTAAGSTKPANNGFNFWFAKATNHDVKKYLTLSSSGDLAQTSTNTISKIEDSGTDYFGISNANGGKFNIEVDVDKMTLKVSPYSDVVTTYEQTWSYKLGNGSYQTLTPNGTTYTVPLNGNNQFGLKLEVVKKENGVAKDTETKYYWKTDELTPTNSIDFNKKDNDGLSTLSSSYTNYAVSFTCAAGLQACPSTIPVKVEGTTNSSTTVKHESTVFIEGTNLGDGLQSGWNGKKDENTFKNVEGYNETYYLTSTKFYNNASFDIVIDGTYYTINGGNYDFKPAEHLNKTFELGGANYTNTNLKADIANGYMVVYKSDNKWYFQILDKATYDSKYPVIGVGPIEGTEHAIYLCGQANKAYLLDASGNRGVAINAMKGSADNQGKGDSDLSINSGDANKLKQVDEKTYKIDVEFINDSYFGIWIDGKHYSAKNSSSNSGSCPEVKNKENFDSKLYNREGWNEHITGGNQKRTVTVFLGEDNNWYLKVRDFKAAGSDNFDGTVTVYLIDRDNWIGKGDKKLFAYNYTDLHVYKEGNSWITPESDRNGDWGDLGSVLTKVADTHPIMKGLDLTLYDEDGNKKSEKASVYTITLTNITKDADGNFSRPKIIFHNKQDQTLNLFLVDNGIYSTSYYDTDGKYIKQGTEYLPNQWYNEDATGDEQIVYAYPNKKVKTPYNVVYIDVPEFTEIANKGGDINFEIRYDRDGVTSYPATGITGTHKAYLTTINGKDYLRVALANYIVKNNTKVELYIWENEKGAEAKTYTSSDHVAPSESNPELVESGNHTLCVGSNCSLWYSNVDYFDGAVYRRGTVTDIVTLTAPDKVYMVDLQNTNGAFTAMKGGEVVKAPTELLSGTYYEMEKANGTDGKTNYIAKNVTKDANFAYVGYWETDDEYKVLSNSEATAIKLGNLYPCRSQEGKGFKYTIDTQLTNRKYTVTMNWENQNVTVDLIETGANFELVREDEDGILQVYNGKHIMFGVSDDCYYNVNNLEGFASHSHESSIVYLKHISDFAGNNFSHHYTPELISAEIAPKAKYASAFVGENNLNRTPDIIPNDETGCVLSKVNQENEFSSIDVRAYTAGEYTLTVSNAKIVDADSGNKISESSEDVDILVIPTIESVGLTLNYDPDSFVNTNSTHGNGAEYEIVRIGETTTKYYTTDENGEKQEHIIEFNENRVGFFPTTASGNIKVYWKYNTPDQTSKPVMRRAVSTDTPTDKGYALQSGMKRYTADNYLQWTDKTDENGVKYAPLLTMAGVNKNNGITLQVEHNGIMSPAFVATATSGGVETAVEEIEAVATEEAVYYDLNGVRVDAKNLVKGIYVKVTGNTAEKVLVK